MKGQGTVIIAVLFLAILIISVVPLVLSVYQTSINRQPVYENPQYKSLEISAKEISRDIVAFFNASSGVLQIRNIGGSNIVIEKVFAIIECGEARYHYIWEAKTAVLSSNQVLSLTITAPMLCSPDIMNIPALYLITREEKGVGTSIISSMVLTPNDIINIRRLGLNVTLPYALSSAELVFPITTSPSENLAKFLDLVQNKGFEIYTLDSISNPTRVQQYGSTGTTGMKGGTSNPYIWVLDRSFTGASISISSQTVRNLWVGYDPTNTSRYNIVITADIISMTIGGQRYDYGSYVRIKIYGFTPSSASGILQLNNRWIRYPDPNIASYTFLTTGTSTTRLTLSGRASLIEIYRRSIGSESSYEPYVMLMNTDKSQGFAGVLFTTIDRTWGFYNSRNEGADDLLDYSTKPLVLVYRRFVVSNDKYSAVILAVNYRFHDNEGSDAEGTTVDLPIFFVGLVDESGNVYSYRSFTFRELTRYEDTYPSVAQAQSNLIFIPLPPRDLGAKSYYVFIAIQDPYSYNGDLDDLDFTLYIESLAILPIQLPS